MTTKHKTTSPILAAVLSTSASTVRQWEMGDKQASGPSLKRLDLLERKGLDDLIRQG